MTDPQSPADVEPTIDRPAVTAEEAPSVQTTQTDTQPDDAGEEPVIVKVTSPVDVDRFLGYRTETVTVQDEDGNDVEQDREVAVVVDRAGVELDPETAVTLRDGALRAGVTLDIESKG